MDNVRLLTGVRTLRSRCECLGVIVNVDNCRVSCTDSPSRMRIHHYCFQNIIIELFLTPSTFSI